MRQRVVTALLLAVPALLALSLRMPWGLIALAALVGGLGTAEADRLVPTKAALGPYVGGILVGWLGWIGATGASVRSEAVWAFAATVVGIACLLPRRQPTPSFSTTYLGGPFMAIVVLHRTAPGGGVWCLSPALMALVPVWAGDIAAIFAGRAFGRRLLMPKVSPRKTVEGSAANLLAALVAAWLVGRLLGIADARALGAGVAVGLLGQAGDLFESWLKRRAGVKDSGTLLPGHGGVLDRIDSVLFAAPAVALILLC